MRLLTHNMLQCPRTQAHPLKLIVHEAEEVSVEYSRAFIERMISRLDWGAFRAASAPFTAVDVPVDPPSEGADEDVWRCVHRALLEWRIVRGVLEAPDGTKYEIKQGIPNMVIAEAVQLTTANDPNIAAGAGAGASGAADDGDGDE